MKLRMRSDLRAAMAGRRALEVEVLRTLLGALDQAEAVPVEQARAGAEGVRFGDPGAEVARRRLSIEDVRQAILRERDEATQVADTLAGHGRGEAAEQHRARAALIERYLA